MNQKLQKTIAQLDVSRITEERKIVLQHLIDYIKIRKASNHTISLNLICTHNSRRSHLSQVWAQTMAAFYKVDGVHCYSGGTESTAVYPQVIETLRSQGFDIQALSEGSNPVYAIKFHENEPAIIAFSKTFDNKFNAKTNFAAVMTCSHADENCPYVMGADQRLILNYEDPKLFDNTTEKAAKYLERSTQIATEMNYIFGHLDD